MVSSTLYGIKPIRKNSINNNILNFNNEDIKLNIKTSLGGQGAINWSNIHQNATKIRKIYQSINFTLDVAGFKNNGANFTIMEISYNNGSKSDFNMTRIGTTSNYTYTYNPRYYDPLGTHEVHFRVYIAYLSKPLENWTLLNNLTTSAFTNFTIIGNCMAYLNSSSYERDQYLLADVLILDYDQFDWKISVINDIKQKTKLFDVGQNIFQVCFQINGSFSDSNKNYYLEVNITKKSSGVWDASFFSFMVLNSPPQIKVSTISFNPSSIYRAESCRLTVNVTDVENIGSDITVKLTLEDPDGKKDVYNLDYIGNQFYRKTFSISTSKPAGNYRVNITAIDKNNGMDKYYTILTVKNNPPEIHSYEVNNHTQDEQISINYGDDLIFTFNVSDAEGLAYIKVALLNEENEWFNITRKYTGPDMKIKIRTIDLITGRWYIYVFVTDTDGETVGLDFDYDTAPQEIIIIPDTLSPVLPWLAFFFGLGLGLSLGITVSYFRVKGKIAKGQISPIAEEKEKKAKKAKNIKIKPKKQLKSSIAQQKEKDVSKIESEKMKKEESKKSTGTPQRKIKRRLK